MSLLQPILEKWHHERRGLSRGVPSSDTALRSSPLGCHATWYRENLAHCSEPMLQYEWAWMNGRIEALEHCRTDARDVAGAGTASCRWQDRFEERLSEAQLFQTLLLREFAARGLRPSPPKGAVIPSEEAWEITSQQVRQDWGIA